MPAPSTCGCTPNLAIGFSPVRKERSAEPNGQKGRSHARGTGGGQLGRVLHPQGLVVARDCDTASVYDATCHPLSARCEDHRVVLGDTGFHRAEGDPPNLKLCRRRMWNERIRVEKVLCVLTGVCHSKKMRPRVGDYYLSHFA